MSNKEHVEALREVMEARGHGCVANWEAPSTKDALQAAIRALEAEDVDHCAWQTKAREQEQALSRYRALVEAANARLRAAAEHAVSVLTDPNSSDDVLDQTRDELRAALEK